MHPVLFEINGFPVASYGVMIMIGVLAALFLACRLGRSRGIASVFFYDLAFLAMLTGFAGARVFSIFIQLKAYLAQPGARLFSAEIGQIIIDQLFSRQGFVFLGGFICAVASAIWFIRRRKLPLFEVGDIVAPALAIGHGFGRIGCFLSGCCHGPACGIEQTPDWMNALAVQYPLITDPQGAPSQMFNFAYWTQMHQHLITDHAHAPLPIFPVQLFESTGNFLIAAGLLLLWKRRRFSGQLFASYLIVYGILRFTLEFWRGDVERGFFLDGAISTSQLISLGLIFIGGFLIAALRGRPIPVLESDGSAPNHTKEVSTPPSPKKKRSKSVKNK